MAFGSIGVVRFRLVALIDAANRMGVIPHNQGGSYEPGVFAALEKAGLSGQAPRRASGVARPDATA